MFIVVRICPSIHRFSASRSPHQNFNLSHGIPGIYIEYTSRIARKVGFICQLASFFCQLLTGNCYPIYLIIYIDCTENIDAEPPRGGGWCVAGVCTYPTAAQIADRSVRVTANCLERLQTPPTPFSNLLTLGRQPR